MDQSTPTHQNPYDIVIEKGDFRELAQLGGAIMSKYHNMNKKTREISLRFGGSIVADMAYYPELWDTPSWEKIKNRDPKNWSFHQESKKDIDYMFSQVSSLDDINELKRIVLKLRELRMPLGLGYIGASPDIVVNNVLARVNEVSGV